MANSPVMTVEVLRYNPENDQEPYLSSYQVPYDNQTSLLDALGYIKDKLEPSLSYRWLRFSDFHRAVFNTRCIIALKHFTTKKVMNLGLKSVMKWVPSWKKVVVSTVTKKACKKQ